MVLELEIAKDAIYRKRIAYLCKKADKIDIYDLKKLKYPINNLPSVDTFGSKAAYGYFTHIKEYAGIEKNTLINCSIKHGMYLTDMVAFEEICHNTKNILVSSEYEKKIMESIAPINAIPVGPFINYASDFYDEEKLNDIKSKNGQTLMVFPTHSSRVTDVYYDVGEFVKEIKKAARNFQTVYVCLGSNDILKGMHKIYSKYGFKVISAGSLTDYYFLNRQNTIIKLCDAFMTNEFTTGCAFALLYNKPIYTFRQKITLNPLDNNNNLQIDKDMSIYEEFYELTNDPNFGKYDLLKEWGTYYFGLNRIRSRSELRDILLKMKR